MSSWVGNPGRPPYVISRIEKKSGFENFKVLAFVQKGCPNRQIGQIPSWSYFPDLVHMIDVEDVSKPWVSLKVLSRGEFFKLVAC